MNPTNPGDIMFNDQLIQISAIMVDDNFKLGGQMYRVKEVHKDNHELRTITFFPFHGEADEIMSLTLNKDVIFKIYNQR
jgi:hypothetical protein